MMKHISQNVSDEKFTFVILHYYTIEDTKKCVESIFNYGGNKKIDVVIVDNASLNNSGVELQKMYKSRKNIHVILNKENLGFAKGNNVGFKYAKDNLNPDFIVVCNNDTYLLNEDFFKLISDEYYESNFAVLGPKILLPNHKINAVTINLPDYNTLMKELSYVKKEYYTNLFYINGLYKKIKKVIKNIFIKLKLKKISTAKSSPLKRYEDIVLHGCFLIFSRKYIDKFDGLDDRTFLYREEELLALRLKNNNLKSVYNPKIEIFHNEDGATNAITKSNRKKQLFVNKNLIISTKILLEEMKRSE